MVLRELVFWVWIVVWWSIPMHWHSAANEAIKLHDSRTYPLVTIYPQLDTSRYIKQVASEEVNHIPSFLKCTFAQHSVCDDGLGKGCDSVWAGMGKKPVLIIQPVVAV